MSALNWLASSISSPDFHERVSLTLLHFLWQGALIALLVALFNSAFAKVSARLRYSVNFMAMLSMAACLPVTFAVLEVADDSQARVEDLAGPAVDDRGVHVTEEAAANSAHITLEADTELAVSSIDESPTIEVRNDAALKGNNPARDVEFAYAPPAVEERTQRTWSTNSESRGTNLLSTAASVGYFVGVLCMLVKLCIGCWGGHRLRRSSTLLRDGEITSTVNRLSRQIGLRSAPMIALCESLVVPVVVGVLKPIVLLPTSLAARIPSDQLEAVLLHELAHIRRWDLLANLLQRIIEVALFFHPAVWFVSRKVSLERENCCDDAVIRGGHQRTRYADALIRLAENLVVARETSSQLTTLAAGESCSQLKQRVARLLNHEPRVRLTRGGLMSLLLLIAMVVATPVAAFSWWQQEGTAKTEDASSNLEADKVKTVSGTKPSNNDERRIGREPDYQTSPKYCLLAFGPKRESTVWMVRDGDTLYVDRNGDRDLTSPNERFLEKEELGFVVPTVKSEGFVVPDIVPASGDRRYTDLRVSWQRKGDQYLWISLNVAGQFRQYSIIKASASKPSKAPMIWFDGPLEFSELPSTFKVTPKQRPTLHVNIGTESPTGDHAYIDVENHLVPEDARVVAELHFPTKGLSAEKRIVLTDRDGTGFFKTFDVPDEFTSGPVGVDVSLMNWPAVRVKRKMLNVNAVAVAPKEPKPDSKANASVKVQVLDLYGQPVERSRIDLYRELDASTKAEKNDWTDANNRKWRYQEAFWVKAAEPDEPPNLGTTVIKTQPGTVRLVAWSEQSTITPVAIGDPLEARADKESKTQLRFDRGGNVKFEVFDNNGNPLAHPSVWMKSAPEHLPPGFIAIPVRSSHVNTFEHLPPGDYAIEIKRSAQSPDDLEYDLDRDLHKVTVKAGETSSKRVVLQGRKLTAKEVKTRWPWVVTGTVTDINGQPVEGATISAQWSTHPNTDDFGSAMTDADGRYRLRFRGIYMRHGPKDDRLCLNDITVAATKAGLVDLTMNRHGVIQCAYREPVAGDDVQPDVTKLLLPDKLSVINFVMVPEVRVTFEVFSADGQPLDAGMMLRGQDLPPRMNLLVKRTRNGRATFGPFVPQSMNPNSIWWWSVHSAEGVPITRPMRFAKSGHYVVRLQTQVDPRSGLDRLREVSVLDSEWRNVRDEVVGYQFLKSEQANQLNKDLQQRGLALLRKLRDANRYWLGVPPAAVRDYQYLVMHKNKGHQSQNINRPSRHHLFERRGLKYFSTIDYLVRDLDNVIIRRIQTNGDVANIDFQLRLPVHVSVMGSSLGATAGTLVINTKTNTLVECRSEHLTERLAEYVEIEPGQFVPLRISTSLHDLEFRFRVRRPGLWLFERAWKKGKQSEPLAYMHLVSVNNAALADDEDPPAETVSAKVEGHIRHVDATRASVWINLGSEDRIRRKQVFRVYARNKSQPDEIKDVGKSKASIEVVRIVAEHLAEARIVEESDEQKIAIGDVIATTRVAEK